MIASGMTDKLFGGVIVILVGDFLQMPVVQGVSLYDALYIRVYAVATSREVQRTAEIA